MIRLVKSGQQAKCSLLQIQFDIAYKLINCNYFENFITIRLILAVCLVFVKEGEVYKIENYIDYILASNQGKGKMLFEFIKAINTYDII